MSAFLSIVLDMPYAHTEQRTPRIAADVLDSNLNYKRHSHGQNSMAIGLSLEESNVC